MKGYGLVLGLLLVVATVPGARVLGKLKCVTRDPVEDGVDNWPPWPIDLIKLPPASDSLVPPIGEGAGVMVVSPAEPDPAAEPDPELGSPEWFEQWRQEHTAPSPAEPADGLPGFEVVHTPWSDVSTVKEGISRVSITPAQPTSEDDVVATVSGWKTDSRYEVDYANVQRTGNDVRLDVYWHLRPAPMSSLGNGGRPVAVGGASGRQSATVTVYDVAHFEGAPYQVTESLGTFSAGTYTLHVTNHGEVPGTAAMTFTVRDAASAIGFHKQGTDNPWSWLLSP